MNNSGLIGILCISKCLLLLSLGLTGPVHAQNATVEEPYNTGWSFHMDNDLFFSSGRDQDYTGGAALSLSGARARQYPWSLNQLRALADRASHFPRLYESHEHFKLHTFETGFILFTPKDLTASEPLHEDHPYASMFFLVNSQQVVAPKQKVAYVSALTFGLLGLSAGGEVQKGIHKIIGAESPKGWRHQISAGGEFTFKYTMGLQKTLLDLKSATGNGFELKISGEANLGMTTDIGAGFNFRVGRISTPWWGFNPHQAEYVNLGSPVLLNNRLRTNREMFFYVGGMFKYRFYNAILQGQFRDSTVTFDRDELEEVIWEAWAGVNREIKSGLTLSLFVRSRSAEISSPEARRPVWGGFVLSKAVN